MFWRYSLAVGLVILFLSCDSTTPSGPSALTFNLISVVFTGDSTGTSLNRALSGKSNPRLEMTLTWEKPVIDQRQTFTVFRSEIPDIQLDPGEAVELQVQLETIFSDSTGLEWNRGYYYAICAVDMDENCWWSNEVYVKTPVSPFPEASQLSCSQLDFVVCNLSWSKYTEDSFASYLLIRSTFPDIEHITYNKDTLVVTDDVNELSFTDFTIPDYETRYYVLVTVDEDGLSSYSNEVEFTPGATIPWRVDRSFNSATYDHEGFVSADGGVLYVLNQVYGEMWLIARSTYDYGRKGSKVFDGFLTATERPTGTILVSYGTNGSCSIEEYTHNLSTLLQSFAFPEEFDAIADIPGSPGILASQGYYSWVLDPVTFAPLDSLSYTFRDVAVSPDGSRIFLRNNGRLICLQTSNFDYLGEISGFFESADFGSDGYLHCLNDQGAVRYDPYSFNLIDEFAYPFPVESSSLLPPDYRMLYMTYTDSNNEVQIDVYDTMNGNRIGRVLSDGFYTDLFQFYLASPEGEFLWFFSSDYGGGAREYRITI